MELFDRFPFGTDGTGSGSLFSESTSSSSIEHGTGAMLISLIACFLSPLSLSIANIIDKFSIDRRVKSPFSLCALVGCYEILVATVELAASPWPKIENKITYLYPVISGTCDGVYLYLYYYAMCYIDASVIVGVMYLYPIVVLILTELFMTEQLSFLAFLGIGLLLSGAITLSVDLIRIFTRRCCPQSPVLLDGTKKKKKVREEGGELDSDSEDEDSEGSEDEDNEDDSDEEELEEGEEAEDKDKEEDDSVCWCPPPPSAWCKKCRKGKKKNEEKGVRMQKIPSNSRSVDVSGDGNTSSTVSDSFGRSSMTGQRLVMSEADGGDDKTEDRDFDVEVSPSPKRDVEEVEEKSPAPEDDRDKESKGGEDTEMQFEDKKEEETMSIKRRASVFLALFGIVVMIGCYEFCLALATAGGMAQFAISGTEVGCQGISALLVLIFSKRARSGFMRELRFNWFYALIKTLFTVASQLLLLVGLMELSPPVASSLCALQPLFVLMLEPIFHLSSDTPKQCFAFKLVPMIVLVGGVICITCDSLLIKNADSSVL